MAKPRRQKFTLAKVGNQLKLQVNWITAKLGVSRIRRTKLHSTRSRNSVSRFHLVLPTWLKTLGKVWGKRALFVPVILVIGLVGWVLWSFTSVPIYQSDLVDQTLPTPAVVGDTMNILVFVTDSNDRYKFVDSLGVLSINKRDNPPLSLILLDTEYGTPVLSHKYMKLRILLANALVENAYGVDLLQTAVQNILGVRIDRYLEINKDVLGSYLDSAQITYIAAEDVNDKEAGSFKAGDVISGEDILKYLAADQAGLPARISRVGKFSEWSVGSLGTWWYYLLSIGNLDKITHIFQTNMSRWELLDAALAISSKSKLDVLPISTIYGNPVQSKQGGYVVGDTIQIDQKVQEFMARSRVVREQTRMEIFNATRTSGLASITKRLLANQGINVVRAGNAPELQEESVLYVSDVAKYAASINLVKEMLRGEVRVTDEIYPYNHTGDLILVIGGKSD